MIDFSRLLATIFIVAMPFFSASSGGATDRMNEEYRRGENMMVIPGAEWEERRAESQGVDHAVLGKAMEYLDVSLGGSGASGAVVIRNGYVIWKGPESNRRYKAYSITKTFTTTVLGLLIGDGRLSLNDPAVRYFPSLDDEYPQYAKINIKHLATMTSGYDSIYGDGWNVAKGESDVDPMTYLVPGPPLFEAGASFKYYDPNVFLLGHILNSVSGESLQSVFKTRIADPIGMRNWSWYDYGMKDGVRFNNPAGSPGPGQGGISLSALDLARFALLYLNRGAWSGTQLIDASWVDQATTNQVPKTLAASGFDLRGRYGFMWGTNGYDADGRRHWAAAPGGTFAVHGASRNFCFVVPEWDMVIVRMDDSGGLPLLREKEVWNRFFEILGKGISNMHRVSQ